MFLTEHLSCADLRHNRRKLTTPPTSATASNPRSTSRVKPHQLRRMPVPFPRGPGAITGSSTSWWRSMRRPSTSSGLPLSDIHATARPHCSPPLSTIGSHWRFLIRLVAEGLLRTEWHSTARMSKRSVGSTPCSHTGSATIFRCSTKLRKSCRSINTACWPCVPLVPFCIPTPWKTNGPIPMASLKC